MKTITSFIVGEGAPSAAEAMAGKKIPNNFGNIALVGFIADPYDPESEVELDTTVKPPVLRLNNALAATLFGYTDDKTGNFVKYTHEMPQGHHIVSGDYDGQPGSKLRLA